MSALYDNLQEIPIPSFAHVNNNDHRVYVRLPSLTGKVRDAKTRSIGTKMSSGNMRPNSNFRKMYPELWQEYYPDLAINPFSSVKRLGLYSMTLAISQNNGLYDCLGKAYGLAKANVLMDYAMASIQEHSNVVSRLTQSLQDAVTFSDAPLSDSYMSKFFGEMNKLPVDKDKEAPLPHNDKDLNIEFRKEWLKNCATQGITECWISIDGSNSDCRSQQTELATKGYAKSGKNVNIISYIYAVDVKTGIPLTYDIYEGNKLDAQAFHNIIIELQAHNIKISGVILDRGFCSKGVVRAIEELKYNYILMLKSDTYGHVQMLTHNDQVRLKSAYIINKHGIFALHGETKIFKNDTNPVSIHLCYDPLAAAQKIQALTLKVDKCQEEITEQLENGATKDEIKIPEDLQNILSINNNDPELPKLECNNVIFDQLLKNKGFYSIACSDTTLTSKQVYQIYHSRDVSEKIFSMMKTQEGSDAFRTHKTASIVNKFTATFIATIIRAELENVAKRLGITTNRLITEALSVKALLDDTDTYLLAKNYSGKLKSALKLVGLTVDCFTDIIVELNGIRREKHQSKKRTINTVKFLEQKRKEAEEQRKKEAEEQRLKEQEAEANKRGVGRPKGSKNKATLEKERLEKEAGIIKVKRNPGRPKGAKNKKTLEKERLEQEAKIIKVKRKPGRPKGAKNKATLEKERLEKEAGIVKVKRKPGRPKGAKNKPKIAKLHKKLGKASGINDKNKKHLDKVNLNITSVKDSDNTSENTKS